MSSPLSQRGDVHTAGRIAEESFVMTVRIADIFSTRIPLGRPSNPRMVRTRRDSKGVYPL